MEKKTLTYTIDPWRKLYFLHSHSSTPKVLYFADVPSESLTPGLWDFHLIIEGEEEMRTTNGYDVVTSFYQESRIEFS